MTHNTINYITKGVLTVGIIILFIFQFKGGKPGNVKIHEELKDSIPLLPIAYIHADSLLLSYYLSIDLRGHIVVKEENARSLISQRVREVEADMRRYKQKLEENSFYSNEESDSEYRRILEKQQDIYQLDERLAIDLRSEQDRVYRQLYDSIIYKIGIYNEPHNYKIIFSNTAGDNVLYAKEWYNITQTVIKFMNHDFISPSLQEKP